MTGLTSTVSAAINLTARLRELDRNLENDEFKGLLAYLRFELVNLSLGLAGAELQIADLIYDQARIREKINKFTRVTGDICPKCRNRTFEFISSKPHPTFGEIGDKKHVYKCAGCGFTESTIVA